MAGVQIKLRKVDGSIIKWVPSAGFDMKSKLDSVNAAALKWTDGDGIQEEITDKERLFDVAGANPAVVFDVVPISTQAPSAAPSALLSCDDCNALFANLSDLQAHVKSLHGSEFRREMSQVVGLQLEMSRKMDQWKSQTKVAGLSTAAELYREARRRPQSAFPEELLSVKEIPEVFSKIFSDTLDLADNSETNGTQPRWSCLMTAVRNLYNSREPRLCFSNIPVNKHTSPSFLTRKPDCPHYRADAPFSSCNIVLVGEVKPVRKGGFTDEDKGLVVDFLIALLAHQSYRRSRKALAYVTDSIHIQFFQVELNEDDLVKSFFESRCMSLQNTDEKSQTEPEGVIALYSLLVSSLTVLQYDVPALTLDGNSIVFRRFLGRGSAACVFEACVKGAKIVAKLFTDKRLLTTEKAQLELINGKLSSFPALVPNVYGVSDDGFCLLLFPVARLLGFNSESLQSLFENFVKTRSPFFGSSALLCADHIISVVQLTRHLHEDCRIAHRDLKLNNILLRLDPENPKGIPLLNDFGSATPLGQPTQFAGALCHAPPDVLNAVSSGKNYVPEPCHDLQMLVRCLFNLEKPHVYRVLERNLPSDELAMKVAFISEFWDTWLASSQWTALEAAAKSADYDTLIQLVRENFLPRVSQLQASQVSENPEEEYFAEGYEDGDEVDEAANLMDNLSLIPEDAETPRSSSRPSAASAHLADASTPASRQKRPRARTPKRQMDLPALELHLKPKALSPPLAPSGPEKLPFPSSSVPSASSHSARPQCRAKAKNSGQRCKNSAHGSTGACSVHASSPLVFKL